MKRKDSNIRILKIQTALQEKDVQPSRCEEVTALLLKNIYVIRRRKFETFMQVFWPIAIAIVFNLFIFVIKSMKVENKFVEYLGETMV
jgi:hypothetical protein